MNQLCMFYLLKSEVTICGFRPWGVVITRQNGQSPSVWVPSVHALHPLIPPQRCKAGNYL